MRIRARSCDVEPPGRGGARRASHTAIATAALFLACTTASAGGVTDLVFADGFESAVADSCAHVASPPAYPRETPPARFPEVPLVVPLGFWMGDFPQSGGQQGRITPRRNRHVSIEFYAPEDPAEYAGLARQFIWQEAQQGGLSVNLSAIYVSVSQCPGDFRIPPTGTTAPLNDRTFASGCRNYRPFMATGAPLFFRTVEYDLGAGPSGFDRCMIDPGNVYYFNFILASPVGGIEPGENPCSNPQSPNCGIQMSIE